MTPFEQFSAMQRFNFETILGLGAKAFEGAEKLAALNLQTAKRLLSETQETTLAALSIKDSQELIALQSGLLNHATDKATAYGRHVYEIATATAGEFTKLADMGASEAKAAWLAAVDAAVKNAPAGSENVATLMKTALAGANDAYEGMQRAAKQASEVAESNFERISESAIKSSQAATSKAKRGAA